MNRKYRFSYFLLSLETRQFFREKYGYFRKKQLLKLFDSYKKPLSLYAAGLRLEMHLGRLLVSSCFVPSYSSARQLISHGHISLNGHAVSSIGCKVQLGDVISVSSFIGRFRVNMYWLQAIEKLFLEDFHLRTYNLKNFSDKKGAIVPVFNRKNARLSKWREKIANLDKKTNRSVFNYGLIKYKNKHSLYIDSINKRYGGWTYKNFRWFPPSWTKRWKAETKALTFKEIVAKRKKRNRLFWSLSLGRLNKIKDGVWSKVPAKGYNVLFTNARHVLYLRRSLNKEAHRRGSLYGAQRGGDKSPPPSDLFLNDVGAGVGGSKTYDLPGAGCKPRPMLTNLHKRERRANLPIKLSLQDKSYKRLLSKTQRNFESSVVTTQSRLNEGDGFNQSLFSGMFSSRWLSFSRVIKGSSNKIDFVRYRKGSRRVKRSRFLSKFLPEKGRMFFFAFWNKDAALHKSSLRKPKKRRFSQSFSKGYSKFSFKPNSKGKVRSNYKRNKFSKQGGSRSKLKSTAYPRSPTSKRLLTETFVSRKHLLNKVEAQDVGDTSKKGALGSDPRASFYPKVFRPFISSSVRRGNNRSLSVLRSRFDGLLSFLKVYGGSSSGSLVGRPMTCQESLMERKDIGSLNFPFSTKVLQSVQVINKKPASKVFSKSLVVDLEKEFILKSLVGSLRPGRSCSPSWRNIYVHKLYSRYVDKSYLQFLFFYKRYSRWSSNDLILGNKIKFFRKAKRFCKASLDSGKFKTARGSKASADIGYRRLLGFLPLFYELSRKFEGDAGRRPMHQGNVEYVAKLAVKRLLVSSFTKFSTISKNLGSFVKDFSEFRINSSRLNYSLDQKALSRLFFMRSKKGISRYRKLRGFSVAGSVGRRPNLNSSTSGGFVSCRNVSVLDPAFSKIRKSKKQASYYNEWRFNRLFRILHLYKWGRFKKHYSYKRTDLRTVIYKVTYSSFMRLRRRYSRRNLEHAGSKGHPLKAMAHLLADNKKLNNRKRYLSRKCSSFRNYNNFLGWKGRFRHWYRKRSRNKLKYKGSLANKYVFNRLLKKMFFTLYSKPTDLSSRKYRIFSKLYFMGRLNQVQQDLLFRLPPKFLEIDSRSLAVSIVRYPYSNEIFRDLPSKVPQDILGMFLKSKR